MKSKEVFLQIDGHQVSVTPELFSFIVKIDTSEFIVFCKNVGSEHVITSVSPDIGDEDIRKLLEVSMTEYWKKRGQEEKMQIPLYSKVRKTLKSDYKFFSIDGVEVGICPTNTNKWGQGYDLIINDAVYVIGSEGMYDRERPINMRSGDEVYFSTLEDIGGEKPDSKIEILVEKAIKKYFDEFEPNCFVRFK